MKPIKLKDIAEQLNISLTTASKALKNYSDVSKETKRKVLALAKKLNYVPNTNAINLRLKQSKTIGVIIPAIVHHFFSKVIEGIIETAEKNGYFVITLQSNENAAYETKQIELLLNKQVDGILISLSNESYKLDILKKIIAKDVALVMFDKTSKVINCSKVIIDDKLSAYNAVSYLIKKGYKKIAHFRASLTPQISIDRFLGYKKALEENNIPFDSSLVFLCNSNDDFKDGYKYAQKIIDEKIDIDAIFAVTDLVAVGALNFFNKNNVKIPDDIAVFGFSNWFMSEVVTPSLSTVEQPSIEMGKKATEILIKEIEALNNNQKVIHQKIVLPTKLIIREST